MTTRSDKEKSDGRKEPFEGIFLKYNQKKNTFSELMFLGLSRGNTMVLYIAMLQKMTSRLSREVPEEPLA